MFFFSIVFQRFREKNVITALEKMKTVNFSRRLQFIFTKLCAKTQTFHKSKMNVSTRTYSYLLQKMRFDLMSDRENDTVFHSNSVFNCNFIQNEFNWKMVNPQNFKKSVLEFNDKVKMEKKIKLKKMGKIFRL